MRRQGLSAWIWRRSRYSSLMTFRMECSLPAPKLALPPSPCEGLAMTDWSLVSTVWQCQAGRQPSSDQRHPGVVRPLNAAAVLGHPSWPSPTARASRRRGRRPASSRRAWAMIRRVGSYDEPRRSWALDHLVAANPHGCPKWQKLRPPYAGSGSSVIASASASAQSSSIWSRMWSATSSGNGMSSVVLLRPTAFTDVPRV